MAVRVVLEVLIEVVEVDILTFKDYLLIAVVVAGGKFRSTEMREMTTQR
jgi:hypothetical protein